MPGLTDLQVFFFSPSTPDESFPQANNKVNSGTRDWKAMGMWPFIVRRCQGLINNTDGMGGIKSSDLPALSWAQPQIITLTSLKRHTWWEGYPHLCTHTSGITYWVSCSLSIPQSDFLFCPFFQLSEAHEFTATFVEFSNDLSLLSRSWPLCLETSWYSSQSHHCTRVFL